MNRFSGAAAVLLLWITSSAQAYTIWGNPVWRYDMYGSSTYPWRSSPDQVFADIQADPAQTYCTTSYYGTSCRRLTNLRTYTTGNYVFNFSVYDYTEYDVLSCWTPTGGSESCSVAGNGYIQAQGWCPAPFTGAGVIAGSTPNPRYDTHWCSRTVPDLQPSPPGQCPSCTGNPILPATGLKLQKETDYVNGATGLGFTRTYRSDLGSWSSIATISFIDRSQPNGTLANNCYQTYFTDPNTSANASACVQHLSLASNAYQLTAEDGTWTQFSWSGSAVTQNADINDRVTQITVSGVNEWQVHRGDDTIEIYNLAGSLLQRTLRGGKTFTFTYSTSSTSSTIAPRPGLLLSESDAFGHTISWQYNAASQVSQMTDPAGGVYTYTYDTTGNLTGVTYPDTKTRGYSYNESAYTASTNLPNALTGITDERGTRYATFSYDTHGRGVGTQHAGGVDSFSLSYASTSPGATATVVDPLGTTRTYGFSSTVSASYLRDNSQQQPNSSGSGTVTQGQLFDSNGNVSQLTDYNGNVTTYTFDLSRNLETSRTEAYGTSRARTITTSWDSTWRQPASVSVYAGGSGTGTPLRTTAYTYDSLGNVLTKTVTDPATSSTRVWTYTYDSYGRMLTADGPRTDVTDTTTYTYYTCTTGYECGQVHTVTDANGKVTTYNTYNAHGQPLTITDPNGVVTTLTYDSRLRVTSRQVSTETTTFSYWPTGLLKQVTLPDSSYLHYNYDTAHRLTQISDGSGNKIIYTLDNAGNRTAENGYDPSSTLHHTHTRAYTALNQLYKDINAAGTSAVTTTYGYDNNGNQTSIAAPLSRNTANTYDELNRLHQITDPASGVTQFAYDANDNLTSVVDPLSLTTSYTYNGFGDLATQSSPDTGTTTNTYDSGGNLATSTDARSAVSTYTYDVLNRVTSAAYKIGSTTDQTITFTYDSGTYGVGRLTGASDANHSMSWTYDALGRVTGKGQVVGGVTLSMGYGYSSGNPVSVVTPSGQTVVYGYNSNHQVTSISINGTTLLNGVTYEPFGGVNGWTWANSTTTSRTYDTDQKITQISSQGVRTNTYDNAFRITQIADTTTGASTYTYGYDSLDRVTSGVGAVNQTFTYDANGNRLTVGGSASSTFTISPTSNRVTAISGALSKGYTYDAAGNPGTYSPISLTYNDRGRLSAVQTTSNTETIVYNALGQMIMVSGGSPGTVLYAYDEAGHLLGEYSSTGALVQETVWLGDIPVATLRPHSGGGIDTYYVHTDHLNTPHQITRPSDNAQMWAWFPATFGDVSPSGSLAYDLRFPGQIYDGQGGLLQNWNRDYDPAVGRYVESDPIGLDGGINTYAYASSNPIGRIDPSGTFSIDPETIEIAVERALATEAVGLGPEDPFADAAAAIAFAGTVALATNPESRTIPQPGRPSCGCTCTCRADANDNIPGNIKPGDKTFAFGTANAHSCAAATKLAKRRATQALKKQPKHIGCKCTKS